ncbi:MAG: 4-alpha-glucanotransferase [Bacilli bacterium]|nr:4-alpha-glucanotransferase [Bacilli bacterium]
MKETSRKAGILMPIASLPSSFGCGDFGPRAYEFLSLLKEGAFSLWQILPINPISYGHSPYQPYSSFALDPIYISLDKLVEKGLLEEVKPFNEDAERIDYEAVRAFKLPYLRMAFQNEMKRNRGCLRVFQKTHLWVNDYAAFMTFKEDEGGAPWNTWGKRRRDWASSRRFISPKDKTAFNFHVWLQKTLFAQWEELHEFASSLGASIIGDIPFYVGFDSADVWANQRYFLLENESKEPSFVAGCPPDYFSKTGQRWGNPIYNWELLEKTDFAFLEERILRSAEIYDVIRLDHFRAFDTYWKVPSSCPTAEIGEWVEAPGYAFFDSLLEKKKDLKIIAEDLGMLREEVYTLRDHYGFPGMNVVEFTFKDAEITKAADWNKENMVCYIGTHDNDPLKGYLAKMEPYEKEQWEKALTDLHAKGETLEEKVLDYAFSRKCRTLIVSLQDLLGLGSESRINEPGLVNEVNWTWRIKDYLSFKNILLALRKRNEETSRV